MRLGPWRWPPPGGGRSIRWIGDRFPYAIFLIAVIAVAFFARFTSSLLVIALSAVVGNYLFVPPRYALAFDAPQHVATLILFLAAATVFALLADYISRTRDRLRATADAQAAHDAEVRAERVACRTSSTAFPA